MSFFRPLHSRQFCHLGRPHTTRAGAWLKACIAAFGAVAAGTALQYWFQQSFGLRLPYLFYFPAVMGAAWYAGFRAGVLATLMSMTALVFLQAIPSDVARSPELSHAVFGACGFFISALCGQLHLARARLTNEKERYRITLASIADGVIASDAGGKVTLVNNEAQRMIGCTDVEAIGRPLESVINLVHEQNREPLENPARRVTLTWEAIESSDAVLLRNDGREFLIEARATPIFDGVSRMDLAGVVLVFRDATETRRQARLLQTYAKEMEERVDERTFYLRQALTDMENFSYSVSHDLRAPLRAIRSYVTVLHDDHGDQFHGEAQEYLMRIQRSAERLERLTSDLLDYARLSATPVKKKPVDLGSTIREVLESLHSEKARPDIQLEGPFPWVLGHDTLLQQVLRNLVDNAVKFVPPDRAAQVRIYATLNGRFVRLHVADNGIGIALHDQKRVFRMFERLDPSRYPGTGMGLAMAHRAMQKLRGSMAFESRPGEGSTFWIELEQCPSPAEHARELSVA